MKETKTLKENYLDIYKVKLSRIILENQDEIHTWMPATFHILRVKTVNQNYHPAKLSLKRGNDF